MVKVSGGALEGGNRTVTLEMQLEGEDARTGEKSRHMLGGVFYEAAVEWDAIVSYPLLEGSKMGVLPSRQCLVLDRGDNFVFLKGSVVRCSEESWQQVGRRQRKPERLWVRHVSGSIGVSHSHLGGRRGHVHDHHSGEDQGDVRIPHLGSRDRQSQRHGDMVEWRCRPGHVKITVQQDHDVAGGDRQAVRRPVTTHWHQMWWTRC